MSKTSARLARSPMTSSAPRWTRSSSPAARSRFRVWTTTLWPTSTRLAAVARPTPVDDPVTNTRAISEPRACSSRPFGGFAGSCCQTLQSGVGRCAPLCGVHHEGVGDDVAGEVEGFVVEVEVADEVVVEVLDAVSVLVDVVGGPHAAEVVATHRQLTDQLGQISVERIASRLGPEASDGGRGKAFPVSIEGP